MIPFVLLFTDYHYRTYNNDKILEREIGQTESISIEATAFLRVPTTDDFEQFGQFPRLKNVFLKFNCIMTSEALMERMFSFAGRIYIFYIFLSTVLEVLSIEISKQES